MNRKERPKRRKRNRLLIAGLALVCVGGAELLACRYFDPQLYQTITQPVRQGVQALADFGQDALDAIGAAFTPAPTPSPTPPESSVLQETSSQPEIDRPQLAGDPFVESDFPLVDPAVTELETVDQRQYLVGNGLRTVYFHQADPRWADLPYGTDNIGGYGCGPTAMAMVVSSLTDQWMDPPAMAQWAVDNGYWASQNGTYHTFIQGSAAAFGLQAESFPHRTAGQLRDALLSGKLLVALMDPGHFTQGGHFIVLRGVTLEGQILVADPNSEERSLTAWDPQIILDELAESNVYGAPLWLISRPILP